MTMEKYPMYSRRTLLQSSVLSAVGAGWCLDAQAQQETYPSKPVQVVIPFPPGGIVDNVFRAISPSLSAALAQPLVVDNKPGAGGSIGAGVVAKARPDGHTLLMVFDTFAVNPLLYKLPFDAARDLTPIALLCTSPLAMVVPAASPANTFSEWMALAKSKPGALNYASTGAGSSNQLAAELFKMTSGIEINHIPYKGGAPAITDLIGGQVDVMFVSTSSVLGHIRAGKLKALAVTSKHRIPQLPGVPSVSEFYPAFEVRSWVGMLAPAQVPPAIIQQLNDELRKVFQKPDVRQFFQGQALDIAVGSPAQFGEFLKGETERWAEVIRKANIKVD
jgi:tripartite-type tricarboxylate transporter receptor subunit TctC